MGGFVVQHHAQPTAKKLGVRRNARGLALDIAPATLGVGRNARGRVGRNARGLALDIAPAALGV
jgi:hypothetical protein